VAGSGAVVAVDAATCPVRAVASTAGESSRGSASTAAAGAVPPRGRLCPAPGPVQPDDATAASDALGNGRGVSGTEPSGWPRTGADDGSDPVALAGATSGDEEECGVTAAVSGPAVGRVDVSAGAAGEGATTGPVEQSTAPVGAAAVSIGRTPTAAPEDGVSQAVAIGSATSPVSAPLLAPAPDGGVPGHPAASGF
jgi:hypothetical protein